MNILDTIRAEMTGQRYSGRALADASGIAPSLLCRYLNGKSELSVKSLNAVLNVLGLELSVRKKRRGA